MLRASSTPQTMTVKTPPRDEPAGGAFDFVGEYVAEGVERIESRRLQGGEDGAEDRHADAERGGPVEGLRVEADRGEGRFVDGAHRGVEVVGDQDADDRAENRAGDAHDEGFAHHQRGDLAARAADGAEDAELPAALGDADEERVGDDEDGDEQDEGPRHEEGLVGREDRLLGHRAAIGRVAELGVGGELLLDRLGDGGLVDVFVEDDLNRVELVLREKPKLARAAAG